MTPQELFTDIPRVSELGLCAPETISCLTDLKKDYPSVNTCFFRVDEAADELIRAASAGGVL